MRRPRIGDVFYTKVPSGYKLYQYAYRVPEEGWFIRVFDGLYKTIPDPEDAEKIVSTRHSYIIDMPIFKTTRVGLSQFLAHCEVPSQFSLPRYKVGWASDGRGGIMAIHVQNFAGGQRMYQNYWVSHMSDLPQEYRDVKLVGYYMSVAWLLYLFEVGFDMEHLERFYVGEKGKPTFQKCEAIIDEVLGEETEE